MQLRLNFKQKTTQLFGIKSIQIGSGISYTNTMISMHHFKFCQFHLVSQPNLQVV